MVTNGDTSTATHCKLKRHHHHRCDVYVCGHGCMQAAPPAQQQEQYQQPQHQGYSSSNGYNGGAQSFGTAPGWDAGYSGEQHSMPAAPSGAPDYIMDSVPQQQTASYYQSLPYSPAAQVGFLESNPSVLLVGNVRDTITSLVVMKLETACILNRLKLLGGPCLFPIA